MGAGQERRPPLPTPPAATPRVPHTYGPSSTILRTPASPNAHDAYPYQSPAVIPTTPQPELWIPYAPAQTRGSTFFVRGSGTQAREAPQQSRPRITTAARPPLPTPQAQKPLPFTSSTSFSPPTSPRALPAGASPSHAAPAIAPQKLPARRVPPPSHSPPVANSTATTKVPLASYSSILVHSGFWNILAATGSRFYGAPPGRVEDTFDQGYLGLNAGAAKGPIGDSRRAVTSPVVSGNEAVRKKRVAVGMIGRPTGFAHLCHASDAEQAEDILRRWGQDENGVGKLAQPGWVMPIKDATRARVRARGIAQVQSNREDDNGTLKVINGLAESAISGTGAEENFYDAVDDQDSDSVTAPKLDRTNSTGSIVMRQESTRPIDGLPSRSRSPIPFFNLDSTTPLPPPVVPSLTTIEKVVAAKVFLELHYHALLKKEFSTPRDQRKAQLEVEISRLGLSESDSRSVRAAWIASETEHLRELRNRVDIGSFVKLKTIGHGAFGVVSLVKETGTGQVYAMKQLRKAQMLLKGQEGHVRAERNLLESAAGLTRWCTRLIYSFQDTEHLYLVMEYAGGGDLLNLLIERDIFPEDFAKFYVAEMLLAIEETHKTLGAIHRDIKPDNFLLSSEGHIRISDFGLATDFNWAHDGVYYEQQRRGLLKKFGLDLEDGRAPPTDRFDLDMPMGKVDPAESVLTFRDRNRRKIAYSVVGTNNYMSVEVLRGRGYDQSCDWWSLGCILYECVYGFPPFVSKSRQQTRQKIMNWRTSLRFPSRPRISRECQQLIEALICEKEDRIGSRRLDSISRPNSVIVQNRQQAGALGGVGGISKGLEAADAIKAHPWFADIDFATIHLKTPPFVPQLKSPESTKYFEDNIDDNPLPAPDAGAGGEITRDPLLKNKEEGAALLDVRKQLAFQGWTYKKPKNPQFDPRTGIQNFAKPTDSPPARERSRLRVDGGSGFVRSLSV